MKEEIVIIKQLRACDKWEQLSSDRPFFYRRGFTDALRWVLEQKRLNYKDAEVKK